MFKISAIEPQKRDPQRVNIYLDGEFAFGLSRLAAGWLQVGQELDEQKVESLKAQDSQENAWLKALHFLSFRPRSRSEVLRNLAKNRVPQDLALQTLERLERAGLVNDTEFARLWVENRNEFRPRGQTALRIELRQKGISDEIIQETLQGNPDEETLAMLAGRKYIRRLSGLERMEFFKKLGAFLARRGFSYSSISTVVPRLWQEVETGEAGNTSEN